MRLRSALAFAALLALAPAARGAVIQDLGNFESGTFGAWQQVQWSLGPECGWVVSGGPEGWISGTTGYEASGAFQVMCDQELPYSTTVLHREFTVPATADSLLLRLWYVNTEPGFVGDMPSLDPGGQGQGLRVDLMSAAQPVLGMAGILASPFVTSYPGNAADFRAPFTLRMGVAAWRGQSVRLRISAMANTGHMNVGVDDVRIEGAHFVEVATGLPGLRDGAARWGDLDDDGDLDLALMGSAGAANATGIWRNDAGAFTLVASAPTALHAGDLEWLDADRDGDLDLYVTGLVAGGGDLAAFWATNQGGGSFAWTASSVPGWNSNLSLADADADGDADLLVGSNPSLNVLRSGDTPATIVNYWTLGPNEYTFSADSMSLGWNSGALPGFTATGRPSFNPQFYFSAATASFANVDGGQRFLHASSVIGGGLAAGVDARTDADGDGLEERFTSGRDLASVRLSDFLYRPQTGQAIPEDVPSLYQPFAAWADLDADGDQDLLVGGSDSGNRYTGVHRWQSQSLVASNDGLVPLARGACAVGDYDGDGDPDVLLLGDSSGGPVTRLYRNVLVTPNLPPAAPPAPVAVPGASSLRLTCGIATDDHTPSAGLSYNFRAGEAPGGNNAVVPDANTTTGRRQVARRGNTNGWNGREYLLLWERIGATHSGSLFWAAQAVDGAGSGGAWSTESVVHVGGWPMAVTDVPGDQGGQVRVRIGASLMDASVATAVDVTSYTIWQRVDAASTQADVQRVASVAVPAPDEGAAGMPATAALGERRFLTRAAAAAGGFPAGTWEAVATVPAIQQPEYLARVSTAADSGAAGANWAVFIVSTHTTTPTVWWVSSPDSGRSVDNIAPGVPQGLAAQYQTGSGNALTWQASLDDDFQYHRVYRGDTPGFAISPATLAANVATTSWHDPAHDGPGVYYKLTAVDHNGNESLAAAPGSVTAVDGGPGPAFALAPPSPSPFAGSTRLAFALPGAADVALEVFDASGRRVRTLARGPFAAGPHELAWDGRGEDGAPLGAGLLFVRLRAGTHEAVRRVVALGGAR